MSLFEVSNCNFFSFFKFFFFITGNYTKLILIF